MKKAFIIAVLVSLLAYPLFADNTFTSDDLDFSMSVPVSKEQKIPIYQIALFFLPASDSFAANVGVQKQKYADTLEAYAKLSLEQMKQMKWNVINHTIKENEIIYEYTGSSQNREIHWYSRALKRGDCIYLITATALESKWEEQKAELSGIVNSFKFKE